MVAQLRTLGVIRFQKIFGLYGLKGNRVEKRWDVTFVDGQRKCEDRARILKQNSQLEKTAVCDET